MNNDLVTKITADIAVDSGDTLDTQGYESSAIILRTKNTTRVHLQHGNESDMSDADAVDEAFLIIGDDTGEIAGSGTTMGTSGTVVDTTSYPVATQAGNTEKVTVDGGIEQTVTFTTGIDIGSVVDTTTYPVATQATKTEKVTIDGGDEQTVTFTTAIDIGSVIDTTTYPVATQAGKTEKVTIDGGDEQTVTFTTAIDIGSVIDTTTYPVATQAGKTEKVTIDGGDEQTVTFTTAIDIGSVIDTTTYPVATQAGNTEKVTIDGGSEQTVTFTTAIDIGCVFSSNGFPLGSQDGLTEKITIDGGEEQTVTFVGAITDAVDIAAQMEAQLTGCTVSVVGTDIRILSDTVGPTSSVEIGTGTTDLTWDAPADVNTAAGIASQMNAQLTDCSVAVDGAQVRITCDSIGADSTVEIGTGTCGLSWAAPADLNTAAGIASEMNAQLDDCSVAVDGAQVRITCDSIGADSTVEIGTGTCGLSWAAPADLNTAAGIASEMNAQLDDCSVAVDGTHVRITCDTVGATSSVAIGTGTCDLTWAAPADLNTAAGIASEMNSQLKGATAEVDGGQVLLTSMTGGTLSTLAIGTGTCGLSWDTPAAGVGDAGPYVTYDGADTAKLGYVGKKRYIRPIVVNEATDTTILVIKGDMHDSPEE